MAIGDWRVRPAANHVSLSAIQNSESVCDAIAYLSVTTISSIILYSLFCAFRYFIITSFSSGCAGSVVSVVVSKSISRNAGAVVVEKSGIGEKLLSLIIVSKSDGNGKSSVVAVSDSGNAPVVDSNDFVGMFVLLPYGVMGICTNWRARRNTGRSSVGNLSGIGSESGAVLSITATRVSSCWGSGAGAGWVSGMVSRVGVNIRANILGVGIVINARFVRIITAVVATYIGNAANTKMPNTNPGNPRKCACIKRCQSAAENSPKLNINRITAHITNTYAIVQ